MLKQDGVCGMRSFLNNLVSGFFFWVHLSSLLPLAVHADQTAQSTGETNEAVVEAGPAEGRRGNGKVAEVRDDLELAGGSFTGRRLVSLTCFDGSHVKCDGRRNTGRTGKTKKEKKKVLKEKTD